MAHKPSGYWNDFSNVKNELLAYIKVYGISGIMPTATELTANGYGSLARAMADHGGFLIIADKLGLKRLDKDKPRGYWDNFSNLSKEILLYIEKHNSNSVMPTGAELIRFGRSDIKNAITKHGGVSVVAKKLKLTLPKTNRPKGFWDDFSRLKKSLNEYIAKHGQRGIMPTNSDLVKKGYSYLCVAVNKHGGTQVVAEKLGLQLLNLSKPSGYWGEFKNLKHEILDFISKHGKLGVMPTTDDLTGARRSDLKNAIQKHGGMVVIAQKLGLSRTNKDKPSGYWKDFGNVKRELVNFIKSHGEAGVMPTQNELQNNGYRVLALAINNHGGIPTVAERLGLKRPDADKPKGYWDNFVNLQNELLLYISTHGKSEVMPTSRELANAKRSDLIGAIEKHGGFLTVSEKLALTRPNASMPHDYWKNFDNLVKEIFTYAAQNDKSGIMPNAEELKKSRRHDLINAINKHGGFLVVAEKAGLKRLNTQKPRGYWDSFENLNRELLDFITSNNQAGRMPTHAELLQRGRGDIVEAISKHGGMLAVATRLKLELSNTDRPKGYWEDFENLSKELRSFIKDNGADNVMPTMQQLNALGFSRLSRAIGIHGGFSIVSRRLELLYSGPQYVTSRTAQEVEITARAIQPLAESSLLSPAQVMVILRRAGLLTYRNPRVVKLGASLARGRHEEIENAIADLVSSGESIGVESVQVQDDLSAEEAAALLNSGLQPSVPLSPKPAFDTNREQAVIRGLTALGELRLPLDEVLSLLTSKVLWNEFYKRLYAWYGSLDATQTVTTQDVDVAIFSAYPEHTANEFVADASALFATEVEQAVNFAATLPDYGWQGPRLRLHQADAARRMTDALSGTTTPYLLDADDPGMGKSASFLAAVAVSGIQTVILVAPKTVADDTWTSPTGEIRRCLPHAKIVRGMEKVLKVSEPRGLTFYVLHYEELLNDKAIAELARREFDCLCLDEIHYIKQRANQEPTRRRSALEDLRSAAKSAIGLTGTPLVNELAEPMSLLQALSQNSPEFDHSRLSNRRLSDIADVFEALLPRVVRRRKSEVLLHLPDCDVRTVPLSMPEDLEKQMLEVYTWPRKNASLALVELRKIATEAKLPYLLQCAQSTSKLLVLTYLTDDVSQKIYEYLEEFLPKQIGHINGGTPKEERQKIIDSFRSEKGLRVLVGTIGTIGVGLTLFDPKQTKTANEIVVADLPYTWAEFEQGIARLHREGQKQRVYVGVLQTMIAATLHDGSPHSTIDERIWELIESKRELSDVAIDGKYDATDSRTKVLKALRNWLKHAREIGVEPVAVERRPTEQSDAQRWRGEIGRLRGMSAARADELFADKDYTNQFLSHLENSNAAKLSHAWLRGRLEMLLRPELTLVDMGCGLNPFSNLPCKVIGLDRHDREGQLKGKMENPPLLDKSADVLIYSLSLYGTSADLFAYFTHAARILRGGGHLFVVEPSSSFSEIGLARFVNGLQKFGFELVGTVKEIRGEEDTLLKAMHFTLSGEKENPTESDFERD